MTITAGKVRAADAEEPKNFEDKSVALPKNPETEYVKGESALISQKSSQKMLKTSRKQRSDEQVMGVRAACVSNVTYL